MTLTLDQRDLDARRGSDFAALCRQVRDLRLLDRRYGSYLLRIAATLGAFAAAWALFIWLGDSWLQLILAGVRTAARHVTPVPARYGALKCLSM